MNIQLYNNNFNTDTNIIKSDSNIFNGPLNSNAPKTNNMLSLINQMNNLPTNANNDNTFSLGGINSITNSNLRNNFSNKNNIIDKGVINQTRLHNSSTFRKVGPNINSLINGYGNKYTEVYKALDKPQPKIGYYGKSRLTR